MEKMPVEMKNSDRADIIDWRSRYRVKIKEYRDKGHSVFYIDESWASRQM
jgi:hypothetical protein